MRIEITTDSNIDGRDRLCIHVKGVVEGALGRFRDRITRVVVHLSDRQGKKDGQNAKRCMMEARIEGRQPTVVTHQAVSLSEAIDGAADKLEHSVDGTLERLNHHR